jgi:hypothetical protein
MSTLEDQTDAKIRKYAKECFERTLDLTRDHPDTKALGDVLAHVHDWMRVAREICESVFGVDWQEEDVFEIYDRIVDEARFRAGLSKDRKQ